jgi:hypothetical protein
VFGIPLWAAIAKPTTQRGMPVFDLNQQAEIIHPLPITANLNVRFGGQ